MQRLRRMVGAGCAVGKVYGPWLRRVIVALVVVMPLPLWSQSQAADAHPRQIMIVGVAHLVSHNDIVNFTFDDPMAPKRQAEIADLIDHLAVFRPTLVLIEKPFGDTAYQRQYEQYVQGTYQLGANEIYQFGFHLAARSKNRRICPIDTRDFPFGYDSVKASAARNGQSSILDDADKYSAPSQATERELTEHGTMLQVVRYLNTPEAIDANAAWYMSVIRVGSGGDYAGAELVSNWYARNLYIFANMMRCTSAADDRVVVIIGAGHAKLLRDFVTLSPDLELVDPVPYLDASSARK